ncbi:MAG: hypothetical protein Q9170_001741 [Blastenia crenularia]
MLRESSTMTETATSAQARTTSRGQRREESHLNDLVSDFGFLSVNATSRDFDGLAQDVFAQLILAPSTVVKLPASEIDVLPPRHTVTSLAQYYIDHDLTLYPFISEAKIFGSIEALYEGHAAPSDEWTVFLILANSLISLSVSSDDGSYAEAVRYAGAVQKHAKMVLLPGSLQAIQMMLLLVQYSMRDLHHFDGWYLAGAAARMTVDLGLHQDPPKATSMVHRRAFSFTDDSISVALPRKSSAMLSRHSPDVAHPAMELIRLRKLVSMPYLSLFHSGPNILKDPWPDLCSAHLTLDAWESNLDQDRLQETQKSLFRAEMLYIKILLLSPARLPCPIEDYGQLLTFEHASHYSQLMSSLVEDGVNAAMCTSYDLLRTIFVARTIVIVIASLEDVCFSDAMPSTPKTSASTGFPRLTAFSGRDRLGLAIRMFSMLDKVITALGKRYGVPKTWTELKPQFDQVYAALGVRWR